MQDNVGSSSAEGIVLAIIENMRAGLEPLLDEVLTPSLYHVYLHEDDYSRLEPVLAKIVAAAERGLDRELKRFNRSSVPFVVRLLAFARRRSPPEHGRRRFARAGGAWQITIQEDPDGRLGPGEVEVVSELALSPGQEYDIGTATRRTATRAHTGSRSPTRSRSGPKILAHIRYRDDRGVQTFEMTEKEIVIGRVADNSHWTDLRLDTTYDVSREHARIRHNLKDGTFEIKDLSKLGTTVDGEPIPSSRDETNEDRDTWAPLPERARIGLAGVIFLDFEIRK